MDPGSPGDHAGLAKGDQILWIDIYQISNYMDLFFALYDLESKQPCNITFKRESAILSGVLIPDSPTFSFDSLVWIILGLLYLCLGIIVYVKTWSEPSSRVFYLMMVCEFVTFVAVAVSRNRVALNPLLEFSIIACLFVAPLFLHFLLTFPERKKIVVNHPLILLLVYLPFLGLLFAERYILFRAVQFYFMGQHYPLYFHYFKLIVQVFLVLFSVYIGIAMVCTYHTYVTTYSPEIKKQVKWILWGHAVSVILTCWGFYDFYNNLQLILFESRRLPLPIIFAVMIPFFTISLSIFKYRLMDIDIVIHRSLAYAAASGIVVLLYFILFSFFSWFFNFIAGSTPVLTMMISALVVSIIFRPLLIQFEQWIDRIFFKEKYALSMAIEDVSQFFSTIRDFKTISERVFQIAETTLNIRSGRFWLLDDEGKQLAGNYFFPQTNDSCQLSIDLTHPLAVLLKETYNGLTYYQIIDDPEFQDHQEAYLEFYDKAGIRILLPLIFNNTLLGMIGFGEKGSGDLYTSEDVKMLSTLARQIAVAMENARIYMQTKSLNNELTEKITQIEQQKDEILTLQKQLLNENTYLREEIQQNFNFDEIIGDSPPMKKVLSMVEKVAPTLSTVLIRGESGTGKELIARAIHFNSPRRNAPFIKVNCAAIPANLLESELFGHEKGAFTGAVALKVGKFELADKGSIFLDEIGDLELDLQVKLLRVLQEKEFERVGGNKTIKSDTRIIAATNRDIEKAISDGAFREDLYFRLNVIAVMLPPLRDRRDDIMALAIHFIRKFCKETGKSIQNIDMEAIKILKQYHWPGNVRELANVIERAVVLGEADILSVTDFPKSLIPASKPDVSPGTVGDLSHEIEQLERKRIIEAMEKTDGNKSEAARLLNLKRSTFGSKLKKYNI